MPWGRERSLVRRVAWCSAAAAALGGTLAAVAVGMTTRSLVQGDEDARILSHTRELAAEVFEEAEDEGGPLALRLARALDEELDELELPGGRAAAHLDGTHVAGEPQIPALGNEECGAFRIAGEAFRGCTVARGGAAISLAASGSGLGRHLGLLMWAALIGIAVGALGGGVSSVLAARWALRPLRRLGDRVRAVPPDAPEGHALGAPLGYAEVDELRLALATLLDRLNASMSHAQRFALDAAHELRTPLTTIAGELELMTERGTAVPPRSLARLRRQVEQLVALVERLLALATPATPPALGVEAVDLAELADAAADALPPDARGRVVRALEQDVLVRGDAALLGAALRNGLDNALKFSGGAVQLWVATAGDEALIEIRDEGPGISAGERARVFEPFYRSAQARAGDVAGHGIGLALVAHVAAGHGGRAELADAARGTCLRIRLPRWRVP